MNTEKEMKVFFCFFKHSLRATPYLQSLQPKSGTLRGQMESKSPPKERRVPGICL